MNDESRLLRNRLEALASPRADDSSPEAGAVSMIVRTLTETAYPGTAFKFIACQPVELDGDEVEGGSGLATLDATRTIYALCLGPKIPPTAAYLVVHEVGGRWAFHYGS